MLLKWLGRLKCLASGLDVSFSLLHTSRRSPSRLPFHQCISFRGASYAIDDIGRGAREMICNLNRSLESRHFFSTLWMKEQILHRVRVYFKVPGWSLVCIEITLLLFFSLKNTVFAFNNVAYPCQWLVNFVFEGHIYWSSIKRKVARLNF